MNPTHPRLLAAIREACPELMDLTFGCKVMMEDDWWLVYVSTGDSVGLCHGMERRFPSKDQIDQILGHEIQLSHVLRTLETLGKAYEFCDGSIHTPMYKWDLTKPLSGQTPETLDWLEKEICET